jgi:hypothetical protein
VNEVDSGSATTCDTKLKIADTAAAPAATNNVFHDAQSVAPAAPTATVEIAAAAAALKARSRSNLPNIDYLSNLIEFLLDAFVTMVRYTHQLVPRLAQRAQHFGLFIQVRFQPHNPLSQRGSLITVNRNIYIVDSVVNATNSLADL